jgi:SAM-dependent methyltransferase
MFQRLREELFPAPDAFDRARGTRTAGRSCLPWTRILRGYRAETVHYCGVDPAWFEEAVLDVPRWPFVDLGCGKGRALILAHELGFQKLTGVEFSSALHRAAKHNLSLRHIDADLICGDAREYRFPDEPTVVFLYHPFGEAIMRPVIANFGTAPRIVVYVNPVHANLFASFGLLASGEHFTNFSSAIAVVHQL